MQPMDYYRKLIVARLGLLVVLYLSTFVLFAIIRIFTGISIKRLGYMSLRHVSFSVNPGVHVSIRKIGLSLHRPTFASPGWVTLYVSNLVVTIDPENLPPPSSHDPSKHANPPDLSNEKASESDELDWSIAPPKTKAFKWIRFILTNAKFFDFSASGTTITINKVGTFLVGNFVFKVDLRQKTVSQKDFVGTLAEYNRKPGEIPASCRFLIQDLYLTSYDISSEDDEPKEFLDYAVIDVKGILGRDDLSLKELSFSIKLGRQTIYMGHVLSIAKHLKAIQKSRDSLRPKNPASSAPATPSDPSNPSPSLSAEGIKLTRIGTLLVRVIKEIELKITWFGVLGLPAILLSDPDSWTPGDVDNHPTDKTSTDSSLLQFNFSGFAKDISLDLSRLNPKSPGFRLFFESDDSAYQSIFSCSSLSLGVDLGKTQEEIIYVPMITFVSKANVFSKTLKFVSGKGKKEPSTHKSGGANPQNQSLIRANINMTSPSIDLETHHVPILLAALSTSSSSSAPKLSSSSASYFQRYWPKAIIKLTVDEPTARVLFPGDNYRDLDSDEHPQTPSNRMVISTCSKIHCDFESSHQYDPDNNKNVNYLLNSSFQVQSLDAWYRTSSGQRYDLLFSDNLIVKLSAAINPSPQITILTRFNSLHISLIKSEVFYGVAELLRRIRYGRSYAARNRKIVVKPVPQDQPPVDFLRKMPPWLAHFKLDITDTSFAFASDITQPGEDIVRGLFLKLKNILIDYRLDTAKSYTSNKRKPRHVSNGFGSPTDVDGSQFSSASHSDIEAVVANGISEANGSSPLHSTGRSSNGFVSSGSSSTKNRSSRLVIMLEGLQGSKIIEATEAEESMSNDFLSIPTFSMALSTARDKRGPFIQCNVLLKQVLLTYDLNFHFLLVLCYRIVSKTISAAASQRPMDGSAHDKAASELPSTAVVAPRPRTFIAVHARLNVLRVTCFLPNKIRTLFEVNMMDISHRREENPTISSKAIRMYAPHPTMPKYWTRIIVLLGLQAELKEGWNKPADPESDNEQILLGLEALRFNFPSQFVFYKMTDNIVTTFKTVKSMHKKVVTDNLRLVVPPNEMKKMAPIPRIRIKSSRMLFLLEDDTFESKLGLIFRAGLKEQRRRLDKEEAFDAKVRAIKRAGGGVPTSTPPVKSKVDSHQHTFGSTLSPNVHDLSERVAEIPGKIGEIQSRVSNPFHSFHHRQTSRRKGYMMVPQDRVPTNESNVSIETAREKLLQNISTSWIRVINKAEDTLRKGIRSKLGEKWGVDELDPDTLANIDIVDYSHRPPLIFLDLPDVDLKLQRPNMEEIQLRHFLYDVGKGLPLDTRFTLLIALAIQLKSSELRLQLRDYPLPLIHFPQVSFNDQDPSVPSVNISGNFVIAEELHLDPSNIRHVFVPITPRAALNPDDPDNSLYVVNVCRTVSSVKMYSDLVFDIKSSYPSRISWASCLQPAIQATMLVFDSFTKPPLDPSDKIGFWDKIRSIFHSRFLFKWDQGDLHFQMKGSRSPYDLLGTSAGLVMCWRNNVTFSINADDNPQELMKIISDEYLLAIPNYALQEREYLLKSSKSDSIGLLTRSNFNETTDFLKILMKLEGKVCWRLGMLFERDDINSGLPGKRTYVSIPHYEVRMNMPSFVQDIEDYDAYRGFRSQYMHLAISVSSPTGRDWTDDLTPSKNSYNTIHLSPRTLYHFFKWWGLFDGSLSLPVRSGPLFREPGQPQPQSKKFGRHLFTIKYKLLLSPLFISHCYRHAQSDDPTRKRNRQASTGLKGKIDSFVMDLHQRREQVAANGPSSKRWRMKLNMGELDFKGTDLRVLMAEFKERSAEELLARRLNGESPGSSISNSVSNDNTMASSAFAAKIKISDNDMSWVDMDDFVEIGEPRTRSVPKITILPLLHTPRWTYFRQTDHNHLSKDEYREAFGYEPFGDEPSHICFIGHNHPEITQKLLLESRSNEIEEQLKTDEAMLDSLERSIEQFSANAEVSKRIAKVQDDLKSLEHRRDLVDYVRKDLEPPTENESAENGMDDDDVESIVEDAESLAEEGLLKPVSLQSGESPPASFHAPSVAESHISAAESQRMMEEIVDPHSESNFNNRFIIHNVLLKWNNSVRDAMYRYMHKVGDRRAQAYFMTRRAVKYIEDLVEEQEKKSKVESQSTEKEAHTHPDVDGINGASDGPLYEFDEEDFEEDLHRLSEKNQTALDTYLVRLISPQIQMVSDQNPQDSVLVTSQNIELQIIEIMASGADVNDESSLIETRYGVTLQDAQFYVLNRASVLDGAVLLFSNNSYGSDSSGLWPPWLAIECCYDSSNMMGSLRDALVVERTTVKMRYDKPNSLRVQNGKDNSNEPELPQTKRAQSRKNSQVDDSPQGQGTLKFSSAVVRDERHRPNRISVDFNKVVASCDSKQYFAIYTLVVDLLIYSEPGHQRNSERLEKVLLATDFSDLKGAASRIAKLQHDADRLDQLHLEFLVHLRDPDDILKAVGRGDLNSSDVSLTRSLTDSEGPTLKDLQLIESESQAIALELYVMMTAIKTAMQKENRSEDTAGVLKWTIAANQIIWHLLDADRKPIIDVALAEASFNRIESADGFNSNTVEVQMMQAFNLQPDTLYPELFSPYFESSHGAPNPETLFDGANKLIFVEWTMQDPIGGIPIMEKFAVKFQPLKLQLEHTTGQRIFEYIFPSNSDGTYEEESPFVVPALKMNKGGDDVYSEESNSIFLDSDTDSDDSSSTTISTKDPDSVSMRSGTSALSKLSAIQKARLPFGSNSKKPVARSGSFTGTSNSSRTAISSRLKPSGHEAHSPLSQVRDSSPSSDTASVLRKSRKDSKEEQDDVALMLKRASNYMSIVEINIESMVICISYKVSKDMGK